VVPRELMRQVLQKVKMGRKLTLSLEEAKGKRRPLLLAQIF